MLGFELKAVWIKMIIIIRYDRVALEKYPFAFAKFITLKINVWYDECYL